ncbi:hypothetical protein FACS189419_01330 [Planctomycetales bacterium]|nr:hypothetical protein FACS189419_01330 [Planctomycetales bacterium]
MNWFPALFHLSFVSALIVLLVAAGGKITVPHIIHTQILWITGGVTACYALLSFLRELYYRRRSSSLVEEMKDFGMFIALVGREYRTLLNAVSGFTEYLLKSRLTPLQHANIEGIQKSSNAILNVVNKVNDIIEIRAGTVEFIQDSYSIPYLADKIVCRCADAIGTKDIRLDVEADPKLPMFLIGDCERIYEAVSEIIDNAVKYTEKGSISLRLSGEVTNGNVFSLVIEIQDTGKGLSKQEIDVLFQFTLPRDVTKDRQQEGFRLGFALCRSIFERMNGHIVVHSVPGTGSTVTLTVPQLLPEENASCLSGIPKKGVRFAVLEPDKSKHDMWQRVFRELFLDYVIVAKLDEFIQLVTDPRCTFAFIDDDFYDQFVGAQLSQKFGVKSRLAVVIGRKSPHRVRPEILCIREPVYSLLLAEIIGEQRNDNIGDTATFLLSPQANLQQQITAPDARILIVDDNEMNLYILAGLLKPYDVSVVSAASGPEAVELIKKEKFDLVFMDYVMPEMTGIDTIKIIRSMPGAYFQTLPIIAATANTIPEVKDQFTVAGFNGYIPKPIDPKQLRQILRTQLPAAKIIILPSPPSQIVNPRADTVPAKMLDREVGMKYSGDVENNYLESLSMFCQQKDALLQRLKQYRAESDWAAFSIDVHSVKSTSKSIGAVPLSQLAEELEIGSKQSDAGLIEEKIDRFYELYEATVAEILRYINEKEPQKSAVTEKPAGDPEMMRPLLQEITHHLQQYDYWSSMNCLSKIQGLFWSKEIELVLSDLNKSIDELDYETSLKIAKELAEQI